MQQVKRQIAATEPPNGHISDDDLEKYHLGMIPEGPEFERLEEHLLACSFCAERAEMTADYVDAIRAAIIEGNWDSDI